MTEAVTTLYTAKKEDLTTRSLIPSHVGIIMDGNRRWAAQKKIPSFLGHKAGAEKVIEIVKASAELGIDTLTLYVFSTENWLRSKKEISKLMALLYIYLTRHKKMMVEEGVRLHVIGDRSKLPQRVNNVITKAIYDTRNGANMDLVLALNYGARDEMVRACKSIANAIERGCLRSEDINEKVIASHLDTKFFKDPDLIIRTSGEMRLSNFLLWQSCYSEFYITKTLWPDFGKNELEKAISSFQKRERRLGGT